MNQEQMPLNIQFYNAAINMHRASKKMPPPCKELSQFEFLCIKLIHQYSEQHSDLPGIKPSMLSEKTQTSRPAMSQHINVLESKGFVERVASKTDRRVTYLTLSEKGKNLIKNQENHLMHHLQIICDMLGHDDTVTLIGLTNKLTDIYLKIAEQAKTTPLEGGSPCQK